MKKIIIIIVIHITEHRAHLKMTTLKVKFVSREQYCYIITRSWMFAAIVSTLPNYYRMYYKKKKKKNKRIQRLNWWALGLSTTNQRSFCLHHFVCFNNFLMLFEKWLLKNYFPTYEQSIIIFLQSLFWFSMAAAAICSIMKVMNIDHDFLQ